MKIINIYWLALLLRQTGGQLNTHLTFEELQNYVSRAKSSLENPRSLGEAWAAVRILEALDINGSYCDCDYLSGVLLVAWTRTRRTPEKPCSIATTRCKTTT